MFPVSQALLGIPKHYKLNPYAHFVSGHCICWQPVLHQPDTQQAVRPLCTLNLPCCTLYTLLEPIWLWSFSSISEDYILLESTVIGYVPYILSAFPGC